MDIKERCPYVYADTECLYDNSLDDCLIRLHNDECDGVITQADILRLYKYNHMKDYIYDYLQVYMFQKQGRLCQQFLRQLTQILLIW